MVLIALSTSVPYGLVIQSCSNPWLTVLHESALDAAELEESDAAELGLGNHTGHAAGSPPTTSPTAQVRQHRVPTAGGGEIPQRAVTSAPSVGSMLEAS